MEKHKFVLETTENQNNVQKSITVRLWSIFLEIQIRWLASGHFFLPLRALAWRKLNWRLMAPSVGGFDRSWNQAIIFGQTFGSGLNNKDVSIDADLTVMQNGRSTSSRLANSPGESFDTFRRSSCRFPLENISLAALLYNVVHLFLFLYWFVTTDHSI